MKNITEFINEAATAKETANLSFDPKDIKLDFTAGMYDGWGGIIIGKPFLATWNEEEEFMEYDKNHSYSYKLANKFFKASNSQINDYEYAEGWADGKSWCVFFVLNGDNEYAMYELSESGVGIIDGPY